MSANVKKASLARRVLKSSAQICVVVGVNVMVKVVHVNVMHPPLVTIVGSSNVQEKANVWGMVLAAKCVVPASALRDGLKMTAERRSVQTIVQVKAPAIRRQENVNVMKEPWVQIVRLKSVRRIVLEKENATLGRGYANVTMGLLVATALR